MSMTDHSPQGGSLKDPAPKELMDNIYRYTRHVYDASRKYFLLGRDHLISHVPAKDNQKIIEIGCGTARNLIKMAEKYPSTDFYGLDASDEMLKTAQQNLQRAKQEYTISLRQAYAQNFESQSLFDVEQFDHAVFSYSLSMIPPWKESLEHALAILPNGGTICIVDFGQQEEMPKLFKRFLFWFLSLFHVHPKAELPEFLRELEEKGKGNLEMSPIYKGYAFVARFTKK